MQWINSGIENPSKSEVIGRCDGDGKTEWRRRTDKSRTLKNTRKTNFDKVYFSFLERWIVQLLKQTYCKLYWRFPLLMVDLYTIVWYHLIKCHYSFLHTLPRLCNIWWVFSVPKIIQTCQQQSFSFTEANAKQKRTKEAERTQKHKHKFGKQPFCQQ